MSETHRSRGNNLDPWYELYAERTSGLSASEVRALFAVASRPEVVSLAGGMPFVSALSNDLIRDAFDEVMTTQGPMALQYGSGQGVPALRERIVEVMAEEEIKASPDDVVTSTGSQQAIDIVAKLFLDPGDVVLAEAPSYVGAIGVFRSYQARTVHVAMDSDGLIPEALREAIVRERAAGRTIKFLYTIPNFHNPAGVTLSKERRVEVLEICRSNGILVIEDNPYGLLYFDEAPPPPMRSLDEEGVVYLGSFSKTLAPGFRVGWSVAPHAIKEKLILAAESAILSPSSFNQMIVNRYLERSDWRAQIDVFRGVYRERKNAMIDALGEYLPDLTWTDPTGGFYVWATLPDRLDSKQMLPRAVTELVAYTPGTAFFADGGGRQSLRLSFCYPTPEAIRVGVRRLSNVVNAELSLLDAFEGTGALRAPDDDRYMSAPPPDLG